MTARPWLRELGTTGLPVSAVTLGASPLGGSPAIYGYDVAAEQAVQLIEAVLRSDIRSIDTANGYGGGESERRIGRALAAHGPLAPDQLVITKVDPLGRDYSGARVRASVDESRQRLGLDHLPLVHLHDPDAFAFDEMVGPGSAVAALLELREAGVIGRLGLAGGDLRVMPRYLDLGVFDVLLVHNRFTLVDRGADAMLDRASSAGLGIMNAAIYGGGILADPAGAAAGRYGYGAAAPETVAAVTAMAAVCRRFGTTLASAALQFSLRDPRIDTTVVGISKPHRLSGTLAAAAEPLDEALWPELEALVPPERVWLDR